MPQYVWQCSICGAQVEVMRPIDLRTDGPTGEEIPLDVVCVGHTWDRPLTAPGVMEHSYVDGQRKNTKDWRDMKESVKLERSMYDLPNKERGKIQKEINRLRSTRK